MTQLIHFKSQFNIHMHGLTTFEYIYITSDKCSLLCIPTSQVTVKFQGLNVTTTHRLKQIIHVATGTQRNKSHKDITISTKSAAPVPYITRVLCVCTHALYVYLSMYRTHVYLVCMHVMYMCVLYV